MHFLKKPIFTLILSLLIGFGLGYYVKHLLIKKQHQKYMSFFNEKGFVEKMVRITQVSEEEETQIAPYLHHRGKQIETLHLNQKQGMIDVLDSLILDLEPHLDQTQVAPIKDMRERIVKHRDKKGKK